MCPKLNPRDVTKNKRYQMINTDRMYNKQVDRVWTKQVREVSTKKGFE